MSTITTRAGKGSPLTNNEVDANFTNLNTDKAELSGAAFTGNITFTDNSKAIFGAGSDLQIYHDGLNSYIVDAGTGDLYFRSASNLYIGNADGTQSYITAADGGAVDLRYNGASKLATTSTGIDVTGTVTADGLTVDAGTSTEINLPHNGFNYIDFSGAGAALIIRRTGDLPATRWSSNGDINLGYEDTGTTPKLFWDASAESLGIGQGVFSGTQALNLKGEGIAIKNDKSGSNNNWSLIRNTGTASTSNVSFVTGSGEAMVLDHNRNVGIGTSSPSALLQLEGSDGTPQLKFLRTGTNIGGIIRQTSSPYGLTYDAIDGNAGAPTHVFRTSVDGSSFTERMRISNAGNLIMTAGGSIVAGGVNDLILNAGESGTPDIYLQSGSSTKVKIEGSNGNVGIGNDSPTQLLTIGNTSDSASRIQFFSSATGANTIHFGDGASADAYVGYINYDHSSNSLQFAAGGAERMRIDSSGRLLVGYTTADGIGGAPSDNNFSELGKGYINLNRDDLAHATQIQFGKNGAVIGRIHTDDRLSIGTSSTGLYFYNSGNSILPYDNSAATPVTRDNAIDLGSSGARFKDLYLSGSVGIGASGSVRFNGVGDTTHAVGYDSTVDGSFMRGQNGMRFMTGTGGGSERMRINSSGNVGIGTSSPTSISGYTALEINNATSGALLDLSQGDSMRGRLIATATTMSLETSGSIPIIFQPTGVEAMRIDSSGNVGIGTSSVDSNIKLQLEESDTTPLFVKTKNSAGSLIVGNNSAGNSYVSSQTSGKPLIFETENSERARIDSSGNLLVGNTSTSVTTDGVIIKPNGETFCSIPSLNTLHVYNTTLGSYRFYVSANGGIYNYSGNNVNLSDEREKKNIENLESQWDSLKQWSLKKFHYNADADSENKKYGVIAQEVETHNPEVIDEFNVDDETTRMAVKEQQMMWMAIKALQEAQTRIETLEARVTELENN